MGLAGLFLLGGARLGATELPWSSGEKSTYVIQCGPVQLGFLALTANQEVPQKSFWKFQATFKSSQGINKILPVDGVDSTLTSRTVVGPWRSVEYHQLRNEGSYKADTVRTLNYGTSTGTLTKRLDGEGKKEEFSFLRDSFEDPISLLYRIRRDLQAGQNVEPVYFVIENKKTIKLAARLEPGKDPKIQTVLLEETNPRKEDAPEQGLFRKKIEIYFDSSRGMWPTRASLSWGPFAVSFLEKTK